MNDAPVTDADLCIDSDGDGYVRAGCGSALRVDCAEGDPDRHPGALEICGNAVDEDCDDVASSSGCVQPTVVTNDNGRIVQNGAVRLHFDSSNGFLPTDYRVLAFGDSNLLQTVADERYIGTHGYSAGTFQYEVSPAVTVLAAGRAVFRVRLTSQVNSNWSVTSHYTVFPDGRIQRNTEFDVTQEVTTGYLTAYAALNASNFSAGFCSYDGSPNALVGDGGGYNDVCSGGSTSVPGYACAYATGSPELMVGMWHSAPAGFNGPRLTESTLAGAGSYSLSLIWDFYQNQTVPVGQYSLDSIVLGEVAPDTASTCGGLPALANWLSNPVSLTLDGSATMHAGDRASGDDDGDGYYEGSGFWAIDAGDTNLLSFTVGSGGSEPQRAAFRIHGLALDRGSGQYYEPQVEINGTYQVQGVDYLWHGQDDPENGGQKVGWLYFNKPLATDDVVTIRVPNGS